MATYPYGQYSSFPSVYATGQTASAPRSYAATQLLPTPTHLPPPNPNIPPPATAAPLYPQAPAFTNPGPVSRFLIQIFSKENLGRFLHSFPLPGIPGVFLHPQTQRRIRYGGCLASELPLTNSSAPFSVELVLISFQSERLLPF